MIWVGLHCKKSSFIVSCTIWVGLHCKKSSFIVSCMIWEGLHCKKSSFIESCMMLYYVYYSREEAQLKGQASIR
jgi:hypothetical protein